MENSTSDTLSSPTEAEELLRKKYVIILEQSLRAEEIAKLGKHEFHERIVDEMKQRFPDVSESIYTLPIQSTIGSRNMVYARNFACILVHRHRQDLS